ncbi:MAG: D-alanyl-D-alanine carboxypeptidase/D-alanyl-D-alanine-endopeptidase [Paracoccaceae bacterium]
MTKETRSGGMSRRALIMALAAGVAFPALAEAPVTLRRRPVARPGAVGSASTSSARPAAGAEDAFADRILAEAALGGEAAWLVADAGTGAVLAARRPGLAMPPASTAKVVTTLYALAHLPGNFRFRTRVLATGPVTGGLVRGDLILAGGGDPTLSTDGLGDLAARLKAAGCRGCTGAFRVWGGALPFLREIAGDQPVQAGYNPGVSGINLNFNRVNLVWARGAEGPVLSLDARGERFLPPVHVVRASVAERELPVYTYDEGRDGEEWTVARAALGRDGSRWLPVRRPEAYAGDVFRTLAAAQGVDLPAPEVMRESPAGAELAAAESEPLPVILRDMLKFSTNLTAEAVGMTASAALGAGGHERSVAAMVRWFGQAAGTGGVGLVDHSGLGAASRMTAEAMVAGLVRLGPKAGLRGLLREIPLGVKGGPPTATKLQAKTGTLNFVSALAGYATTPGGRELAFAIFTGDPARREAALDEESERPVGAASWAKRARRLQGQLLLHWGDVFDG